MKTVKTDTVHSFPPVSRKRKIRRLLYSAKAAPYIFTAPFVLSFCIFFLYPLI
ncbi:arabinose transporter permease, partial [Enterococcus faecium]